MATIKFGALGFDKFYNVINGELKETAATRHSINPATSDPNPEVPLSTPIDVEEAIAAARAAFPGWAKTQWVARRDAILQFAGALEKNTDDFATLLTREQGKPPQIALGEIANGIRWLRGIANLDLPSEVVNKDATTQIVIKYVPLGVSVAIVPWNYPVMLACGKIAASLLTGNSIILKVSPFTPYCGLKMAELAQSFFPAGVFQALSGDDRLGPWLTSHPGIDKISFTGSTATGKKVMESASKNLTRVTLELGGNDAAIVCSDADIDSAVPKIATLSFLNSGQICVAIKRVYVHESIYNEFRDKIVAYTRSIQVGVEKDAFMGPLQNKVQYDRVQEHLDDIKRQNYHVPTGNHDFQTVGYFINPTIVDNPADDSRIVQEEPFGPILPLLSWSNEEEVIRRANSSCMGLGASVWSTDPGVAARIAEHLEAGSVWINSHLDIEPNIPFAGHKSSGIGCEWGVEGLKGFCNIKAIYFKQDMP
ncbi:aldehyde dehydrogenase [Talaromyces proteolyticus]|uniref:aldehyde dehydrogenase (NAD(+)) n=1 Tax=Talaromyces proteolyticus TaxID=1131652 RepID=A0AAD4L6H6_9EURO|nr:aldehyde dehydrogenase [Talaromyces proteolyticus]KAH8706021.1 aldehyde dehydrogenase [Talaromyces proteolyticus]